MLDIPKQSREGLNQLFIDIKGIAKHQPFSEVPLVIEEPKITVVNVIKASIFVFIFGCIAGIGYILFTNPVGLLNRLMQIWHAIIGVV